MSYQSKLSHKILALSLSAAVAAGTIAPAAIGAAEFEDVKAGSWYEEAVTALANDSILSGYKDGTFKPSKSMTRAEAVKVIVDAKGLNTEEVVSPQFSDVKEGDWYYKYIAAAKAAGIVVGNGTDKFNPNEVITRAEMASILVNTYDLTDTEAATAVFTDVNAKDWFFDEVQALVENGIAFGTTETTFSPKAELQRAQGASFVYRAITELEGPIAGEFTVTLKDAAEVKGDFAGKQTTDVVIPLDSTLTGLSLNVKDYNLKKEDVLVQLTGVPESYPSNAPAIPNTWGTLKYNETTKAWDLVVPETNNPYSFNLEGSWKLEAKFADVSGNELSLTLNVTVKDQTAPAAGQLSVGLANGNSVTADFAGKTETALEIPLNSTLTSLSLNVADRNLLKEDVLVQLTGVPESYPETAPAVPNTWGKLKYNETTGAWDLVVPATDNPYSFNLAGDWTLEASFKDVEGNTTALKIVTTVK